MVVCSCHVMYTFQSQSTLYNCLNVKKLFGRNKRKIWRLSDCNWTWTHNHLVHKRTLNHLSKLAKWLSLAKWLIVHLWTKWLWVRVQLQSLKDFGLDNILIDEKSFENVLVCNISYKLLALRIRFDKIDGFIRVYDGTTILGNIFATK